MYFLTKILLCILTFDQVYPQDILISIFCLPFTHNMSRIMRKPAFCICENEGADQLHGNHAADQRLCFSLYVKYNLRKFMPPAICCGCTARFVSDLLGNPENRFSLDYAQMVWVPVNDKCHSWTVVCRLVQQIVMVTIVVSILDKFQDKVGVLAVQVLGQSVNTAT